MSSIADSKMPEQEAIGMILSDMDTEIAALEAKLAKARQIKQVMMHEFKWEDSVGITVVGARCRVPSRWMHRVLPNELIAACPPDGCTVSFPTNPNEI